MKKNNMYHTTIFWTSALTALVGCSYYKGNNKIDAPSDYKHEKHTEQNNTLPNLRSGKSYCSIHTIIHNLHDHHIIKFIQDIQENKSSFNEENLNRFIKKFEEFLDNNKEKLNNGLLLSLPIDYDNASVNQEPIHLIKLVQQPLISQSNKHALKDPNRIYLRSLTDIKKTLLTKIHKVENLPYIQHPDAVRLLAEKIRDMIGQEDKRNNLMSILLPLMHGRCCKTDKKDKKAATKISDSILDSFLDYHYKLFNVLIIHAFNESICKREIKIKKAQEQYSKICKLITEMYRFTSINNSYEVELTKLLKKTASSDNLKKLPDYNDINIINKLSKDCFRSINDKINKVNTIINSIPGSVQLSV